MSRPPVALVDASVAVKWLFIEDYSDQADALLQRGLRADVPLVAPALLPNEIANAIHRRLRSGLATDAEATDAVVNAERILDGGVELLMPATLPWDAFAFAKMHGLGAIYDALYVVLAERLGAELWTDDRNLLNAVGRVAPWIRWIGDYSEN